MYCYRPKCLVVLFCINILDINTCTDNITICTERYSDYLVSHGISFLYCFKVVQTCKVKYE
jgi:hypothetical protein